MRKYFVLFGKENKGDKWEVLFSDYSRQVVSDERGDSYEDWYQVIIEEMTSANDAKIVAKLNELNGK